MQEAVIEFPQREKHNKAFKGSVVLSGATGSTISMSNSIVLDLPFEWNNEVKTVSLELKVRNEGFGVLEHVVMKLEPVPDDRLPKRPNNETTPNSSTPTHDSIIPFISPPTCFIAGHLEPCAESETFEMKLEIPQPVLSSFKQGGTVGYISALLRLAARVDGKTEFLLDHVLVLRLLPE